MPVFRSSALSLLSLGLGAGLLLSGCDQIAEQAAADRAKGLYFVAEAQAKVYPAPGGGFEVVPPIGSDGARYWCAASRYAQQALGAAWSQDIYVKRGLALGEVSGRINTVVFTLDPVARETPQPLVRRIYSFKPGDALSVASADSYCNEMPPLLSGF
ncbi:hypothetical protein [Phaeobacter sp. HF9A]|uniref:hypothetical protein n=1 Tax=Phaeobacter sp. HF9A TaxID=2721561 RepID=UPI00142F5782|nr:hypothetical protein [Phaeobacter sp. HF9A]NIZ14950.1 hypothetical protein [Phaeobacter sp. HF9A]